MPELPEVETIKNGILPYFLDSAIKKVTVNRIDLRKPVPFNLDKKLRGLCVKDLLRRGKYIAFVFDEKPAIIMHMGMSGRIRIYKRNEAYNPMIHDHVVFQLKNDTRIVYNDPRRFGMVYLSGTKDGQNEPPFSVMGPDPLTPEFTPERLQSAIKNKTQSIKAALLDQRVIAGIGNIYACEALFLAGVLPSRPAGTLNQKEIQILHRAIIEVLNKAIEAGGSTLKDYRQASGELGYFQNHFYVYDRESKTCLQCQSDVSLGYGIKRILQAGRSTFYCPVCQH